MWGDCSVAWQNASECTKHCRGYIPLSTKCWGSAWMGSSLQRCDGQRPRRSWGRTTPCRRAVRGVSGGWWGKSRTRGGNNIQQYSRSPSQSSDTGRMRPQSRLSREAAALHQKSLLARTSSFPVEVFVLFVNFTVSSTFFASDHKKTYICDLTVCRVRLRVPRDVLFNQPEAEVEHGD